MIEKISEPLYNFRKISSDCGKVVYSSVKKWYNKAVFKDISIKYTIRGKEFFYDSSGKQFKVDQGCFLLGRFEQNSGECKVNLNASFVDALSIYIKPEVLDEIYASLVYSEQIEPDIFLSTQLKNPNFYNGIFAARHSLLQGYLCKIASWHALNNLIPHNLLDEYLIEISEKIILLQYDIHKSMANFSFQKESTRKEVMRRLLVAKTYLDDCYKENPPLDYIASVASLSKYHLLRNFKQAFKQTPFEYLQNKRLNYTKEKLVNNNDAIKNIASECSFYDIASFSKAFKNKFGVPPSVYKKLNQRSTLNY